MIGATLRQHLSIILLAVFALAGTPAQAQEPLSTKDKKAIKRFEEAQTNIQYNQLELAEVNLQLAIERDPNFKEAYIVLGQVYAQSRQDEQAIEAFDQLIALDPNFYPPVYFTKGSLEIGVGKYAEAEKSFTQYLTFGLNHPRMDPLAKQGLANCAFAKEAIQHPVPFEPKNLGPEINSRFSEYFPCLTADEGLLLYTRRLEDPRSPSGYNEDFYYAFQQERDGRKYWQKARNLGPPVNSLANEGAPTVSADGQTIIFTACADLSGEYGPRRNGAGSCDLFTTRLSRDRWDEPRNLGNKVNTRNWETQPSYAADGKTLYFIRGVIQRGGGRQQDIWFSEYVEKKGWSAPQKLPNHINTPGREESVFAHPDGKTLYFSSDGHPGMGGLDIYRVRKNDDGEWGKPENLGYPINSHNDENSLLVSASGSTAYFASDREGGFGELDLYSFELPEALRPDVVTYLEGTVVDKRSNKPLRARFELIDVARNEVVVQSWSSKFDGEFLVSLPTNREYALNVSKEGYQFHSEHFRMTGPATAAEPFRKNIALQQLEEGVTVALRNIFFDTDKFDLKPTSVAELQKLQQFLTDNPTVSIEVRGHTDDVGDAASNQQLSENRAKAVYEYLVEKGIEATRLTYKGYGETEPEVPNDSDANRAQNRRTEIKILKL